MKIISSLFTVLGFIIIILTISYIFWDIGGIPSFILWVGLILFFTGLIFDQDTV